MAKRGEDTTSDVDAGAHAFPAAGVRSDDSVGRDTAAPAASPSTVRGRRNLQLDVLRGVAILLVIGRHINVDRPSGVVGILSRSWYRVGWLGVDLFFVLSGFLIGGLLLSELARYGNVDVRRFLLRRGFKLYPLYYAFILALMLGPVAKSFLQGGDGLARLGQQFHLYWPNLLFLQNYVGANPAGHTWSLAVEEHFYLLLPFVLVALAATGRMRWVVPAALVVGPLCLLLRIIAVWTDSRFAVDVTATHLRIDALLFGVAVRALAQYRPQLFLSARRLRLPLLAAGAALWLPMFFIEPETAFVRTFGLSATFLGSAAFLLAAFHTHAADLGRAAPWMRRVAGALAGIGVYSYAIYLWHVVIIRFAERRVAALVAEITGRGSGATWLVTAVAVTALAVLVGTLVSKVVEWPVLRFRDRFFPSRAESLPPPSR